MGYDGSDYQGRAVSVSLAAEKPGGGGPGGPGGGSYTFSEKEEGCRTVFLGNLSWSVEVHLLVIIGGIIYGDFV